MGFKNNDPCLDNAKDDEPIFVLLARDPIAAETVRFWCSQASGFHDHAKIQRASDWADIMERRGLELQDEANNE